MAYYKWNRVFNSEYSYIGFSGIMALGKSGILRPIEGDCITTNTPINTMPLNTEMSACVPYFDGYLLITPGLLIYTNMYGQSSENKIDLALIDGVMLNKYDTPLVVLGTSDGKIIFGKEALNFQEYTKKLKNIKRINKCNDKAIICGNNTIAIMWQDKSNNIKFKQLAIPYNLINAYLYDDKIFAYSDDGYLNIYFVDSEYNIMQSSLYRINIAKHIVDAEVLNMYIDYNKSCDVYFTCDHGMMAVIPEFNFTQDTIDDLQSKIFIYAAKLTPNSYFMDMIKHGSDYIIVGYGEELHSFVKTKQLKESIIIHNLLNDISGPQRYMYNFASSYESKSDFDVFGLNIITYVEEKVFTKGNKKYINWSNIDTKGHEYKVLDIPDSVVKYIDKWPDPVEVNTDKDTSMVKISICINKNGG